MLQQHFFLSVWAGGDNAMWTSDSTFVGQHKPDVTEERKFRKTGLHLAVLTLEVCDR
jgi:hypothetical protein